MAADELQVTHRALSSMYWRKKGGSLHRWPPFLINLNLTYETNRFLLERVPRIRA